MNTVSSETRPAVAGDETRSSSGASGTGEDLGRPTLLDQLLGLVRPFLRLRVVADRVDGRKVELSPGDVIADALDHSTLGAEENRERAV
jgi:hypothetical protein